VHGQAETRLASVVHGRPAKRQGIRTRLGESSRPSDRAPPPRHGRAAFGVPERAPMFAAGGVRAQDDLRERRDRWRLRVLLRLTERERRSSGPCSSPARTCMHSGVIDHSVGGDELTPALLLRHELAHVHVPRPDCSHGREPATWRDHRLLGEQQRCGPERPLRSAARS
jgi:hypothetical protein